MNEQSIQKNSRYYSKRVKEITKYRKDNRRQKIRQRVACDREIISRRLLNEGDIDTGELKALPRHPLDIVHEEGVWEDILGYLNNPEDVVNAYNSCALFHDLLQRKATNALFPLVLAIMQKQNYLCYHNPLERSAILRLRLISKSWKQAVDKVYFEDRYQLQDWHLKFSSSPYPVRNPVMSRAKVDQIISSLQEHDNQILFTRELTIVDPFRLNEIAINEFHFGVTNLLEICGDSIWGLTYHTRRSFRSTYTSVRTWCELMPNLRVLRVKNLRGFNQDDAYIDDDMRAENMMLQFGIRQNPFPSMEHLQHFEERDMPCSFSSEILRSNSGIKSVAVSEINFEMSRIIVAMRLDRFSLFKFQHHTTTYFISNPGTNPFDWPLKKISLQYTRGNVCCRTAPLFQYLNKYGNSLEELDVGLDLEDNCDSVYLELPKLRILRWKLNSSLPLIDFIIPLESLKILCLVFEDSDVFSRNEEIVRFNEEMLCLNEICFWNCFPSLKKVVMEDTQGVVRRSFSRP